MPHNSTLVVADYRLGRRYFCFKKLLYYLLTIKFTVADADDDGDRTAIKTTPVINVAAAAVSLTMFFNIHISIFCLYFISTFCVSYTTNSKALITIETQWSEFQFCTNTDVTDLKMQNL